MGTYVHKKCLVSAHTDGGKIKPTVATWDIKWLEESQQSGGNLALVLKLSTCL